MEAEAPRSQKHAQVPQLYGRARIKIQVCPTLAQVFSPALDLGDYSPSPWGGRQRLGGMWVSTVRLAVTQKHHQSLDGPEVRGKTVMYWGALGKSFNTFLPHLPHYLRAYNNRAV